MKLNYKSSTGKAELSGICYSLTSAEKPLNDSSNIPVKAKCDCNVSKSLIIIFYGKVQVPFPISPS